MRGVHPLEAGQAGQAGKRHRIASVGDCPASVPVRVPLALSQSGTRLYIVGIRICHACPGLYGGQVPSEGVRAFHGEIGANLLVPDSLLLWTDAERVQQPCNSVDANWLALPILRPWAPSISRKSSARRDDVR